MQHGRLPWYEPEAIDDRRREVYDQILGGPRSQDTLTVALVDEHGRLNGPFNAMLVDPEVGAHIQALGSALRYHAELSGRLREIATLSVARARRSSFEWASHVRLALAAGLSQPEIDAILEERPAPSFDARDQLVRRVADVLLETGDLDDALFGEAEAELGIVPLTDLVTLVGYYEMLALMMRVNRVPLPPGFTSPFEG